ncbi:MAG TPA: peptide MFS transporter [bacterium]|nr:peptide MFS transporter [bacterium]HQG44156.1 peptide MFS transporter [bacterium]HQI49838.1 peptide MFS transporter [bacterium]HQJ64878.1 peptide MFS transporter [bacterium]
MLKGHPKGLLVAFFANMGERFGFYTMVAIFILFLQAKYGMNAAAASQVYGIFMFFVYFFPLLGGFIADRFLGFSKTISIGLIVMFIGYLMLATPTPMNQGFSLVVGALAVIALGTGLFKGNLQALVGKMYEPPEYAANRDRAFSIFYMGINIGAMLAPTAAEMVSNWVLAKKTFHYDAHIPALANQFLNGELKDPSAYLAVARAQDPGVTLSTLGNFSQSYINQLSQSYHYAFSIACISLIISMLIFWIFRRYYREADYMVGSTATKAQPAHVETLTPQQTRERLIALGLVYFVVIFFWMSFHQNGVTMTYFARDYTQPSVGRFTNLWFDLFGLLPVFFAALGLYYAIRRSSTIKQRIGGAAATLLFLIIAALRFQSYGAVNPFTPQKFQHFNPFFIVALTPVVVGLFSWLNAKGKEPSAPRKIGFGMLITAAGFFILVLGSLGLPSPKELGGQVAPSALLVSPYWLISTYLTLTIAELFLSPMGISFVARVAPPKYKGVMQGGWFAATALGNYLLSVIGFLWMKVPLWSLWTILVICCLLSAAFIFSVMKRLERATQG